MRLGVTLTASGANVAVWAPAAERVWFCLRTDNGERRTRLPYAEGGIWHGVVPGVQAGDRYAIRAAGPGLNPRNQLIDPYARALDGRIVAGEPVPYGIVVPDADGAANRPDAFAPADDLVIYEAHVKGLTAQHPDVPEELRGTYAGAALMAPYLAELGVTALELLPVQAFIDDAFVLGRGLTNYWGYQPIAWHAPEPRYAHRDADAEMAALVEAMHAHGIAVIIDVVYNHTGESGPDGPTLSLRGLAPQAYRTHEGQYVDDTGTGNTIDATEPGMLRLILDSMRHWATRYGVDGFRFDLAATLGRTPEGFSARAAFFQAIGQDPVLSRTLLIAEPWDIGPGGYQLGAFPHPWREWNDRFRDDVRRAWRGDEASLPGIAARLLGSADAFDHSGRTARASVNFVTAHDGFTLHDLVSYAEPHNEANGENGEDGHRENLSSNGGTEGPDAGLAPMRERRMRGMIAMLALSQGTPMLLAGDEVGNSQGGNNNAYAQDNPTGWIDWIGGPDHRDFVRAALATRRRLPVLRQRSFLHGGERSSYGRDVTWLRSDGTLVGDDDWADAGFRTLTAMLRGAAGDPDGETLDDTVVIIINLDVDTSVDLPSGPWRVELDSSLTLECDSIVRDALDIRAAAIVVLSDRCVL